MKTKSFESFTPYKCKNSNHIYVHLTSIVHFINCPRKNTISDESSIINPITIGITTYQSAASRESLLFSKPMFSQTSKQHIIVVNLPRIKKQVAPL